jgi:hypothetical protein
MNELRQRLVTTTYVVYQHAYKLVGKIGSTTFLLFDIGINHRVAIVEIVKLFFEQFLVPSTIEFVSIIFRHMKKKMVA